MVITSDLAFGVRTTVGDYTGRSNGSFSVIPQKGDVPLRLLDATNCVILHYERVE